MSRRFFATKTVSYTLLGVLALVALLCIGYQYATSVSNRNRALAIARTLGSTDDTLLVNYQNCGGLMGIIPSCEEEVIFTTADSLAVFQGKLAHGGWVKRGLVESSFVSAMFGDINAKTAHHLTGDGWPKDGIAVPGGILPEPWEWRGQTPQGKRIIVRFCPTADQPVVYVFDGKHMTGNIVQVVYFTS